MTPLRFDWRRLLIGEAPWAFLGEVLLRIAGIYLVLVVVVRLLGKRQSGRVGNLELAVLLALGAIVSVPFQDPKSGVLPSVVLLLTLLALQSGLSSLGARFAAVERLTQNRATMLVADGALMLDELRRASISPAQLFAVLRGQGVRHLGQIKRLYLEGYGGFSTFRQEPAKPGLSVAPEWDDVAEAAAADASVCKRCGAPSEPDALRQPPAECSRCGGRELSPALTGP